jgi:hypothetical protein
LRRALPLRAERLLAFERLDPIRDPLPDFAFRRPVLGGSPDERLAEPLALALTLAWAGFAAPRWRSMAAVTASIEAMPSTALSMPLPA